MTITALDRMTLAEVLRQRGITARQLAIMAGISPEVTARAATSSPVATHVTCAEAIAEVLGLEVSDILWVNGLSTVGRPCHTGVAIGARQQAEVPKVCPAHFMVLPATGVCGDCN